MTRFVRTGKRQDVFFSTAETPFDVGLMLLTLCAYPEAEKQVPGGIASRFWEALYYLIADKGRSAHPISGVPARRPTHRSAASHLNRGFDRLNMFLQLNTAMRLYQASGGTFTIDQGRDLRGLEIKFLVDEQGRLKPQPRRPPPSIYDFLKYHQPAIGLGRDELGTSERETTKTLRKRVVRPMLRVSHVLTPLKSAALGARQGQGGYWPELLLRADPKWAIKVVNRSRQLAPVDEKAGRRQGVATASVDNMIHFHLPQHVQILPPP